MSDIIIQKPNLLKHNTYKLIAHAEIVYYPETISEIQAIIKKHENIFILGNGSNVIFTQKLYKDMAFLILNENFAKHSVENTLITANAGTSLKQLSLIALDAQLSNLEVFYDIPASVGGAIWMNAGAYGESIYDYIVEVTILDRSSSQIKTYPKEKIQFSYRHSMFQKSGEIILSAKFSMTKQSRHKIKQKMDYIYALRNDNLPKEHSAGSVFKRPKYHISVGEMVEKLGLKGYVIGGAMISKQHGGIIINADNALADDILSLIKLIKNKIKQEFNVSLELEQILI